MATNRKSLKSMQIELAKQQMPYYMPLLQWASGHAGLPGLPGPVSGAPSPPPQATGTMVNPTPTPPPVGTWSANRFQDVARTRGFGAQPAMGRPAMGPQAQLAAITAQQPGAASVRPTPPMIPSQGVGVPSAQDLGVFGLNPADVFRRQQAEEEANRLAGQRARLLQYRLGRQGIGAGGAAAAALAQNERAAQSELTNFLRQLAIGAAPEQERRLQLLMQMLGMGAQQGAQGQGVHTQQQQISASKPSLFGQLAPLASMFTIR